MLIRLLAAAGLALPFLPLVAPLPPISVVGTKFYDSNGNQFFIKGVAYTLGSAVLDVLLDPAQCARDAALLKTLGANTIRVYTVDSSQDHTGCMNAFESAGIYVLLDMDTPLSSFNRAQPTWTTTLYSNFSAFIDTFSSFNNTLGFFVGNEDINDVKSSTIAPYLKAAVLDLKKYSQGKGYRSVPIGYSSADLSADELLACQNYMSCGDAGVDFFGVNRYSWCGASTFTASGYDILYSNAAGYNVPLFLSETGCNAAQPRGFTDMEAILGPQMNSRWSGAIVYNWLNQEAGYGIVVYPSSSTSGTPTPIPAEFDNLQARWATLTPTGTPYSQYTASVTPPACPNFAATAWSVSGNVALPTLNKAALTTRSQTIAAGKPTGTKGSDASPTSGSSNSNGGAGHSTGHSTGHSKGLSKGAKAGIGITIVLLCLLATGVAILLWRRRRQRHSPPPVTARELDYDGLEVGVPPPKAELDSTEIDTPPISEPQQAELPASETEPRSELPETQAAAHHGALGQSILAPVAMRSPPAGEAQAPGVATYPELSAIPPTPKPAMATAAASMSDPARHETSSVPAASRAKAPWEMDEFPRAESTSAVMPAQTTTTHSTAAAEGEDEELKRLEEEERRIDAAIAESERIRALKEEKAVLQRKRVELMEARGNTARS